MAMSVLGNGLFATDHHEDALTVQEAELSMKRRIGASEHNILVVQSNIAGTYATLGRLEEASRIVRDVYSGHLKLDGEDCDRTHNAASNYAASLLGLKRFKEAKSLMRKAMPVARRVLGQDDQLMLRMRSTYAEALYKDPAATLDDLREAVTENEVLERTARRVLGGAHPLTLRAVSNLRNAREALVFPCTRLRGPA
jgi:hypothetical protein